MKADGKIFAFILFLMACAFGFGLHLLLAERFYRGDSYPPYSSFRSDPLGARALYLALDRVPGIEARRNFTKISRLSRERGTTFFFLGVDGASMGLKSEKELRELEELAQRGNRLVIALTPLSGKVEDADSPESKGGGNASPGKGKPAEPPLSRWGLALERIPGSGNPLKRPLAARRAEAETGLPDSISLRSNIWFRADGNLWKTLYSAAGYPVMVERVFGRGSLVLLADSYPAGNKSLKEERHSGLLLRLLGGNRTAVFDESHLGVFERPGIMSLMVKYRLIPFLSALMLLACLCLWRNAVPLVPSRDRGHADASGVGNGRDAVGGLVNLLRRNIPPVDLLDVCFGEWKKSFPREFRDSPDTLASLRSIAAAEAKKSPAKRDPAEGYRRMTRIIAERKRR